ncbi:hypothetical protein MRX96_024072 [Rhipicephalus microplus]
MPPRTTAGAALKKALGNAVGGDIWRGGRASHVHSAPIGHLVGPSTQTWLGYVYVPRIDNRYPPSKSEIVLQQLQRRRHVITLAIVCHVAKQLHCMRFTVLALTVVCACVSPF